MALFDREAQGVVGQWSGPPTTPTETKPLPGALRRAESNATRIA
jgi:hypothetical protein